MKINGATEKDLIEYIEKYGHEGTEALPAGPGLYVAEIVFGDGTRVWIRGRASVASARKSGKLVSWAPLTLGTPSLTKTKRKESHAEMKVRIRAEVANRMKNR